MSFVQHCVSGCGDRRSVVFIRRDPQKGDVYIMPAPAKTVIVLMLIAVAIEETHGDERATTASPKGVEPMNVMVDVKPAGRGKTLPSCLVPLMRTVGRPEWSVDRLKGVMGHAFHFEMKEGGGPLMHDNLDWGPALSFLPQLAVIRNFEANKHDKGVDLPALKREARDAARISLQRGIPVLAWQPMSLEQKASDHPAHSAYCWGLIVGYDEEEETYTIRHPFVGDTYTVRYDAIGHTDPVEWFNIKVFDRPASADPKALHLIALRNAVAFAHGTRFAAGDEGDAKRRASPHGFSAYELWQKAFDSEDVPLEPSRYHAHVLKERRVSAAAYLRELVTYFPEAAGSLNAAAAHYDRELQSLNTLYDLCAASKERGEFNAGNREEAQRLIGEALKEDREAIARIEAALALIDGSG